jgi:hypothetical protein
MALALPRQYLRALNRQRRGDRTRWHAPSRPVGPATSQHDGGRAIRERAAYLMGVVLREPSATDPIVELARELYAQSRRVAGAWRGARECAAAVLRGEDGGIPGDVRALSGQARQIADASGCSLKDGLRGAYEMARTVRNAFPDEDAFARAYLQEAVMASFVSFGITRTKPFSPGRSRCGENLVQGCGRHVAGVAAAMWWGSFPWCGSCGPGCAGAGGLRPPGLWLVRPCRAGRAGMMVRAARDAGCFWDASP